MVGSMPRGNLSNRRTSSISSRSLICLDAAGCVMCNSSAARWMLRCSSRAINSSNCRVFRRARKNQLGLRVSMNKSYHDRYQFLAEIDIIDIGVSPFCACSTSASGRLAGGAGIGCRTSRLMDEFDRAIGLVFQFFHGHGTPVFSAAGQLVVVIEDVGLAVKFDDGLVDGFHHGILVHDGATKMPRA